MYFLELVEYRQGGQNVLRELVVSIPAAGLHRSMKLNIPLLKMRENEEKIAKITDHFQTLRTEAIKYSAARNLRTEREEK